MSKIVDIPVAHAVAVPCSTPTTADATTTTRPSLATTKSYARSSHVLFPKQKSKVMDNDQILALREQGFTRGLAEAMTCNNAAFPSESRFSTIVAPTNEIRENVLELEPSLKEKGQKVAIVIATDGLPNVRHSFVEALRSLEGLPVWIVIRLCTDDDKVVEYYNNLDSQLELSLEVLDDWEMEAKEVYEHNKFLNYTLPLHRCREMGYHHRIFDLLDERKLTMDELQEFLVLLFGEKEFDAVPDPQIDWRGFLKAVTKMVEQEQYHWNPINHKAKVQPTISVTKLNKEYGGGLTSFFRRH